MTEKYNLAFKEKFKAEQLKTELIANVSHDIKTPLTSIINYADIIQAQSDVDSEIGKYTNIIHKKSIRLKSLIEDLIEASKIGTGNIKISPEIIDICELMGQIVGEYDEVANEKELVILSKMPQTNININVDSRYLWRVLENLFSNAIKYSLPQTRIYVDLQTHDNECCFSIKNISKEPLNILPDELTNQFVRGDKARSTAGNGLGLYIAKSL
ncbi:MAG: HAMP domain-containing sensor histidine kinase, partial [Oscillospiraceae bacterium]